MSITDNLSVAILSIDIALADKEANKAAVEALLKQVDADTDLIVLPELFSTGYINNPEEASALAETDSGETIGYIKKTAKERHLAICGSFLAKDGHALFNRGFFVEPSGETAFYDKRHLFCLSEESKICEHGAKLPWVVRYRRWNISMAVCYDLRFPVWLRNTDNRYDLLVIPANWPDKRQYAWERLLEARAIENQSYVIGANRSGSDHFGIYDNSSYIIDFTGHSIGATVGYITTAVLNKSQMEMMREHFPVGKDSDDFVVKLY